jgi:glycosyltransferase involved in cell wall biosynthesis
LSETALDGPPLVTIGIPTYMRPRLLERALGCVARQGYSHIEVIVADNNTPGDEVDEVVRAYAKRLPNLKFIKHPSNIGSYANFFAVLEAAHGKYFMWLADDDEISDNYVEGLVDVLERNPGASTAAGRWVAVLDDGVVSPRQASSFPEASALARCLRYIWHTDDAFFYALHRTSVIRRASFPGFWWPNRRVLLSWAYVFLFDLVLRGQILIASDASVVFVNHTDAPKQYDTGKNGLLGIVQFVVRQINVHFLYLRKVAGVLGIWHVAPAAFVSFAALCREVGACLYDVLVQLWRRRRK